MFDVEALSHTTQVFFFSPLLLAGTLFITACDAQSEKVLEYIIGAEKNISKW